MPSTYAACTTAINVNTLLVEHSEQVALTVIGTEEGDMIVRIWHGCVPTSKAEAYRAFTYVRVIPDYQCPGF